MQPVSASARPNRSQTVVLASSASALEEEDRPAQDSYPHDHVQLRHDIKPRTYGAFRAVERTAPVVLENDVDHGQTEKNDGRAQPWGADVKGK
jgi:hypothetical protein